MSDLRNDALDIIDYSIKAVLPDNAVKEAIKKRKLPDKIVLVAIGKAAWRMAKAAHEIVGDKIKSGVVITKYHHSQGKIGDLKIFEAGHPVPDENTIKASSEALKMVSNLSPEDTVLFLVSGGGSALFEVPQEGVTLEDLTGVTNQLLRSGADIVEINTIRKRLSAVKGGRFALLCKPAKVLALVLSDVLGDRLDSIASGPAYPDSTTWEDAIRIIQKYGIQLRPELLKVLKNETPKSLDNVETEIIGSVSRVCEVAAERAKMLGYEPMIFTTTLDCEAREAGSFIAAIIREVVTSSRPLKKPCALIFGGETVVHVRGNGKGGRNQELALAAATKIEGLREVVIASVGTDGTDGPTDAAGGIADGNTAQKLKKKGINIESALANNDSYHALDAVGSLIKTGPTGTNVNDLIIALCK
ncbi:glycerate kinase [Kosmotoga olearia]|uniref:glycerate 2-kinase n=1 Tax=Kosmotoga olearia (strain ATCC BAA-1733 / DSM 21960 / TBF 19.5.1) TaxID=521045 RepID=C5CFV9_KOSOT|nr:glycerate kinase [Kosmotoga olearia]ACR80453.1 Hydroxypyruvate reductase [Kosmotoga olearia TBF 19.5.1]OAA19375.1 glycerate kinase [Kosmotoga sp. DU53]